MDNSDLADRSHFVECEEYLDEETWATIVQSMPIPSVDLVVKCPDGILLGKRANEPAKGKWFVPGGRIQKGEPHKEAVYRVAKQELEIEVTIEDLLGAYDHFYENSDVSKSGGKHYIAHAYVVSSTDCTVIGDGQHSEFEIFESLPKGLHPYVETYLKDAGLR